MRVTEGSGASEWTESNTKQLRPVIAPPLYQLRFCRASLIVAFRSAEWNVA
ncbi:hypothetical protein USDA257_c46570 [Sinorhizobium fredii USDA 257]|uniref:Uncharacterized protein n=1 Tax=Sinorhizobium fredii (strain USDA 257) TaxID=1185652 RepID=I3XBD8_SINF2|nr:hypothetical protein USDA257_c46570 [Sinorhizobium fredii USDA 257]